MQERSLQINQGYDLVRLLMEDVFFDWKITGYYEYLGPKI
jgi:hypothetical protein